MLGFRSNTIIDRLFPAATYLQLVLPTLPVKTIKVVCKINVLETITPVYTFIALIILIMF